LSKTWIGEELYRRRAEAAANEFIEKISKILNVKEPPRVRVMLPKQFDEELGFKEPNVPAACYNFIDNTIYIRHPIIVDRKILLHELCHCLQWEEKGLKHLEEAYSQLHLPHCQRTTERECKEFEEMFDGKIKRLWQRIAKKYGVLP